MHIIDLAEAHIKAINRLINKQNKQSFEIFNLGIGKGSSVLEVIDSFERVSEMKLNYTISGRRPGDVEQVWSDATLANTELGWKATRSLDEAVLSAWNWEKKLRNIK